MNDDQQTLRMRSLSNVPHAEPPASADGSAPGSTVPDPGVSTRTRRNAAADTSPVRLSPTDMIGLGLLGLRTRKMRAALSALGISIGIATMIIVTAIPASSRQALMSQLASLGTNMLRVQPNATQGQPSVPLPENAAAMARRIGPVTGASAVANTQAIVRRSDRIDPNDGSGLTVLASDGSLLKAINGHIASGRFLSAATRKFPTVVLGSEAAHRLGIPALNPAAPPQVLINRTSFTVIGILQPMPLAPEIERSVLVGWDAARATLSFDGHPTVLYIKAREDAVEDVRDVLAATVSQEEPDSVQVSRPSDALAAKRATESAFSAIFLGLAGVALLVGGIGVANTMVISVLERRKEIGLRRALGASRSQIRGQFLTESVALSFLGGTAGTILGAVAASAYALYQGWPPIIPPASAAGGFAGALLIGVVAGVYPCIRAARLTPTEALAAN